MEVLAFLLLFGVASASFPGKLDDAADKSLAAFFEGMGRIPPLGEHYGEVGTAHSDIAEDEIKTEIAKLTRLILNLTLERVKNAIEEGKIVRTELFQKIKGLRTQLKELKGKELLQNIKEMVKDYYKRILHRLKTNKRSVEDRIQGALSEMNIKDLLRKLKEHLKKTVDTELIKQKIEKLFVQGSEILDQLLQTLKEKGRKKMEMLIDLMLDDDDDDREARALSDYWEKLKDYFKDLKIDLQEKYMKFGEWVKEVVGKGMEHSKDKMENIQALAKEFVRHAKGISKEVAIEAGEFFRNYKKDLGDVWEEIKERINEIKNRKD